MIGILLVDKPAEWTSMDVCAHLRGVFHEKHIGHTGTLDPNATGLLVVLIGKATKLANRLEADNKRYVASMQFGITTDTQDIWGNVLSESATRPEKNSLEAVLTQFKGEIYQTPPMYSAIKIKGKKLYEIARKGGEVKREPRRIIIHNIDLLEFKNDSCVLDITCSKGTYIRTLCNDIGMKLECGACMNSLRRTEAGIFKIEQAHTLEEIKKEPERFLLDPALYFEDFFK